MYLYRALNNLDRKLDVEENGLINKKSQSSNIDINDLKKKNFEFTQKLVEVLNGNITDECEAFFNWAFTELKNQLERRKSTWISTSKEIDISGVVFSQQSNDFKVAVIEVDESEIFRKFITKEDFEDFSLSEIVAMDLSSGEKSDIYQLGLITNKDGEITSHFADAIRFPKSNSEVLIYNYVPKERIVFVHDQFSYDLVNLEFIDEKILYSLEDKYEFMANLKDYVRKELKKSKICEYEELFSDLYDSNIPTSKIALDAAKKEKDSAEKDEIEKEKIEIIKKANNFKKIMFEYVDIKGKIKEMRQQKIKNS